jgi:hypothetical protein
MVVVAIMVLIVAVFGHVASVLPVHAQILLIWRRCGSSTWHEILREALKVYRYEQP